MEPELKDKGGSQRTQNQNYLHIYWNRLTNQATTLESEAEFKQQNKGRFELQPGYPKYTPILNDQVVVREII